MNYEDFEKTGLTKENMPTKETGQYIWNAAAKEAARICRSLRSGDPESEWDQNCEYLAVEIEQQLITTQ
jgi:hypothetical protein